MIDFIGAHAGAVRLLAEKGFQLDVERADRLITPRTKLIMLN